MCSQTERAAALRFGHFLLFLITLWLFLSGCGHSLRKCFHTRVAFGHFLHFNPLCWVWGLLLVSFFSSLWISLFHFDVVLCHFVHLFCAKRHKFLQITKSQNNSEHAKGPQTHWTLIFPSGFSGAGGDLAARWFACWAMSRRAASRGSMRKSSEVFSGQGTTGTRSRKLTWTGPGAALMVRPVWTSPGRRSTALSWRRAAPSRTVGNRLLKGRVRSS